MYHWDDDERKCSMAYPSFAPSAPLQKDDQKPLHQILKEYLTEERERWYTTSTLAPLRKKKASMWFSDSDSLSDGLSEVADISEEDTSDYDGGCSSEEKEVSKPDDDSDEVASAPANVQTTTMDAVIDRQVYRKFGYV
jgi:hypothetical protein